MATSKNRIELPADQVEPFKHALIEGNGRYRITSVEHIVQDPGTLRARPLVLLHDHTTKVIFIRKPKDVVTVELVDGNDPHDSSALRQAAAESVDTESARASRASGSLGRAIAGGHQAA